MAEARTAAKSVAAVPKLRAAACTHPGRIRPTNEDVPVLDVARGVFGVIDGIGGHNGGEVAAAMAGDVLAQRLARPLGTPAERVREAIAIANNTIFRFASDRAELEGMACVITLAIVSDGWLTIGHVGDTRLYKLRGDGIRKLTRDHSPVGEREDAGQLSEIDAMRHPHRNEVFRDVGTVFRDKDEQEFVDVLEEPLEPDAAILVCSDGLSDMLPSATIAHIVRQYAGEPEQVVEALVAAANDAGGKDNVTVVYAEMPRFAEAIARVRGTADQWSTPTEPPPSAGGQSWAAGRSDAADSVGGVQASSGRSALADQLDRAVRSGRTGEAGGGTAIGVSGQAGRSTAIGVTGEAGRRTATGANGEASRDTAIGASGEAGRGTAIGEAGRGSAIGASGEASRSNASSVSGEVSRGRAAGTTAEHGQAGRLARGGEADAGAATASPVGGFLRVVRAIVGSRMTWFTVGAVGGVLGAVGLTAYVASTQVRGSQTLTVAADGVAPSFPSITAALAAARPGDVVRVEPGQYRERIVLRDGIDLVARVPGTVTILPPAAAAVPAAPAPATAVAPAASAATAAARAAAAEPGTAEPGAAESASAAVLSITGPLNVRVSGIRIETSTPVETAVQISAPAATFELVEISGPLHRAFLLSPASAVTVRGSRISVAGTLLAVPDDGHATFVDSVLRRSATGPAADPAVSISASAHLVLRGNVFAGFGTRIVDGVPPAQRAELLAGNIVVPAEDHIVDSSQPVPPAAGSPARRRGTASHPAPESGR